MQQLVGVNFHDSVFWNGSVVATATAIRIDWEFGHERYAQSICTARTTLLWPDSYLGRLAVFINEKKNKINVNYMEEFAYLNQKAVIGNRVIGPEKSCRHIVGNDYINCVVAMG